jgi:hypothetical protein
MYYTPTRQGDRIRLYPTPQAAQDQAADGQAIHAVAVHLDGHARCLTPMDKSASGSDAGWRAPVELHDDGSVTADGPIPAKFFVN